MSRLQASRPREGGSIPSTVKEISCYLSSNAFTTRNTYNPKPDIAGETKGLFYHISGGGREADPCKLEINTDFFFITYHVTGSHLNTSCRNVSELFREL